MLIVVYTSSGSLKCVKCFPLGGWQAILRCYACSVSIMSATQSQTALCHRTSPFLLIKGFTIFLFPFLFHSLLPCIPVLAQFPTPFSCLWPGADLQWRVRVFLVFVLQPFSPDWSRVGAGLAASSAALSSYHPLLPEFFHCFLPLCPVSTSVTKCLFCFSPKQRLTLVYSFQ